jgi:branched-chain amino acid transport system permease protein
VDTLPILVFQCLNGIVWGLIFAMIALGLSLTFGLMNLMNVAHGSFYMLGAMGTAVLNVTYQVPFALSVLISTFGVVVIGLLSNQLIFHRLTSSDPLIGLLATAGLLFVLDSGALAVFGSASISVPDPFGETVSIVGIDYPVYRLLVAVVSLLSIGALFLFLRRTKYGLWMRAVPESKELALIAGVEPRTINRLTIVLGSLLAALAGGLVVPIASANFQMGLSILGPLFIVVVVGGAKNLLGTVCVAMLLGIVRGVAATFLSPTEAEILSLVIMLPLLVIRPNGIFGGRNE